MQNFFSMLYTALCVIKDTVEIIAFVDKLTDILSSVFVKFSYQQGDIYSFLYDVFVSVLDKCKVFLKFKSFLLNFLNLSKASSSIDTKIYKHI